MNRFLPWDILLIKKLEFEKKTNTVYKTDTGGPQIVLILCFLGIILLDLLYNKIELVFSVSNFFTNKMSQ